MRRLISRNWWDKPRVWPEKLLLSHPARGNMSRVIAFGFELGDVMFATFEGDLAARVERTSRRWVDGAGDFATKDNAL